MIAELLNRLEAIGAKIVLHNDGIGLEVPENVIVPNELLAELKLRKPELIKAIQTKQDVFSLTAIQTLYPNNIAIDACTSLIAKLKQQPAEYQTQWWLALSQWLTTGTGDIKRRRNTFDQLSDYWNLRHDFLIAKDMFAGTGSRIVLNGKVMRNEG